MICIYFILFFFAIQLIYPNRYMMCNCLFVSGLHLRWRGPLFAWPTCIVGFYRVGSLSPHSDTLSWLRANQTLLFLFNAACLTEKQQYQILSFWLDPTGAPTIYRTQGENANHYTPRCSYILFNVLFTNTSNKNLQCFCWNLYVWWNTR